MTAQTQDVETTDCSNDSSSDPSKLLEHKLRDLFPSAVSAGIFLFLNGFVLLTADQLSKRAGKRQAKDLSYLQSLMIRVVQAFALIPGFSRSGITMTAGLSHGLSYEEAARFSFLLTTPIILGAGVLDVAVLAYAGIHL